jgi:hypothetical protein
MEGTVHNLTMESPFFSISCHQAFSHKCTQYLTCNWSLVNISLFVKTSSMGSSYGILILTSHLNHHICFFLACNHSCYSWVVFFIIGSKFIRSNHCNIKCKIVVYSLTKSLTCESSTKQKHISTTCHNYIFPRYFLVKKWLCEGYKFIVKNFQH